ncbi:Omega-amidase chloroplastic [Bienertia sinuspersici]
MQFKIALCQLMVTCDKATNLVHARNMLKEAADMGAQLLVLPEMWVCPYSHEYFAKCAEHIDSEEPSPIYNMLSKVSCSHQVTIVGGSIPERRNGQLYDTCCVFGPDGKLKAKHSKLHLFDYHESGDSLFMQSDSFSAGDMPTLVDTGCKIMTEQNKLIRMYGMSADVGCIGIGICHDIRFPELAMLYRAKGADLIIYPGAFNMSTGKMLWELETKARQVLLLQWLLITSCLLRYVHHAAILLDHTQYGSGKVIASAEHEEKIVIAEIDYAENLLHREYFPIQRQRKEEIYQFRDLHN